ncbi:MAG: GTP cyclohydrolase II [Myxococcota bacterium]
MTAVPRIVPDVTPEASDVEIAAEAPLPTRHGNFRMIVFRHVLEPHLEQVVMALGDLRGDDVLVRVHSECMTSEVFGSLKCDCADQLERALQQVAQEGRGAVIYLRQEGRGIGLANKVRAYALQARGVDTVDANRVLGLPDDARRYDAAAAVLRELGVRSIRLMTNNPSKVDALRELGVEVRGRVPVLVALNPLSHAYVAAKRDRMNHLIPG